MRITTCPRCLELVDPEVLACPNCGAIIPDPGRRYAVWARWAIIGFFVCGAIMLAGSLVFDFVRDRL